MQWRPMMMTMILEFLFLLISAVVDVIRFDLCLLQLRAFDPLAFGCDGGQPHFCTFLTQVMTSTVAASHGAGRR